jgi:hypothetical protein
MTSEDHFRERYKSGDTRWDIGQADFNLIEVVTATPIQSCKASDVGCGTGDNSIWLAQKGFHGRNRDRYIYLHLFRRLERTGLWPAAETRLR